MKRSATLCPAKPSAPSSLQESHHVAAWCQASYPDSTPDAFAAPGYDAARLLLTAIHNAGSSDPDRVWSALASIREFDGVTGQMGFQDDSQIPLKSVTIFGVDGGTLKLVEQVMPVRAPAP